MDVEKTVVGMVVVAIFVVDMVLNISNGMVVVDMVVVVMVVVVMVVVGMVVAGMVVDGMVVVGGSIQPSTTEIASI